MGIEQGRTTGTILGGAVTIVQPQSGYRFAIDSILLARFARPRRYARVLELGAGCGVVSIIVAALHRPKEVVAVELQPCLAAMIAENATLNRTPAVREICADIRRSIPGLSPASFDYVITNPPYRAARRGRESPNPERRVARGGEGAGLTDFIAATSRYAANGGRVALIFTASRITELIAEMKHRSLEPKRLRFVHSQPAEAATMVLIEARKAGGIEAIIEPPLFIYDSNGEYTGEARRIMTQGG
jgi:tRNA1Val (adenine37-N6)-methyltransferase